MTFEKGYWHRMHYDFENFVPPNVEGYEYRTICRNFLFVGLGTLDDPGQVTNYIMVSLQ